MAAPTYPSRPGTRRKTPPSLSTDWALTGGSEGERRRKELGEWRLGFANQVA
ncbi:hypothetical protein TRIUR3_08251 [Triticum urartu]|uniref:Uncharacterized protein n=1 Tax=Triticum urartu TaxID=4572 RepID=M7ZFU0_TRIUA|nr:hypothetical protein TRIUR3_08251 [Triticum urartu]